MTILSPALSSHYCNDSDCGCVKDGYVKIQRQYTHREMRDSMYQHRKQKIPKSNHVVPWYRRIFKW